MKQLVLAGVMLASALSAFAAEWSLKPVEGNVAHKWKQGIPNWTWDQKNPCADRGRSGPFSIRRNWIRKRAVLFFP